ncbi:hypothetical protein QE152_g39053 [Popillia japonica]|uniref:Ig-like domain-containing protein n=1 Tax=Popillia japonica TaxID=7064 RepID=A0AAW1HUX6_POPJA
MNFIAIWLLIRILIGRFTTLTGADLKWVRVSVPQYRIPGDMALLQCDYNLGNDNLYAVKWYKDNEEFFKFLPKARPEASSYSVEGIHVDMKSSNRTTVVLYSLNFKSSGLYRCEVSAEAPSFASAQGEARMEIVYLPKEDPQISGVEREYQIGEMVNLNCTSGKSHPASILHWYVNEQQVLAPGTIIHYPPIQHRHGLSSSILGLRFVLTPKHFVGGSMKIKCIAVLSPVLWMGDKESVVQSLPIKQMREALLLVRSSAPPPPQIHSRLLAVTIIGLIVLYHS